MKQNRRDSPPLNDSVFLSRDYPLIVVSWKFDTLKTTLCFLFPRGNYQTCSPETETRYCVYCSPLNFLPHKILDWHFDLTAHQMTEMKTTNEQCTGEKSKENNIFVNDLEE